MKTLILFASLLLSVGAIAQGQLIEDGRFVKTINQYDLAGGDTEFVISINSVLGAYTWGFYMNFLSLTGTLDATVAIYQSSDKGATYVEYPGLSAKTIAANGPVSLDDPNPITYDRVKLVVTVNGVTGGTLDVNERLVTVSKH